MLRLKTVVILNCTFFLPARRSKRGTCYGIMAGWLAGWVGGWVYVRHTPVLYQNG